MYGCTAVCCPAAISSGNSAVAMVTQCRPHVFRRQGEVGGANTSLGGARSSSLAFKGRGTETGRLEEGCETGVSRTLLCSILKLFRPKHVTNIPFRHQGTMSGSRNEHNMSPLRRYVVTVEMFSSQFKQLVASNVYIELNTYCNIKIMCLYVF